MVVPLKNRKDMNKDSCRRSRKERIELVKSFDKASESETREKRQSVKCWRSGCVVEDEDEVWSLMDGVEGGAKPFQLGSRQGKVADHPVVWRVRRSTERAGCRRNNHYRLWVTVGTCSSWEVAESLLQVLGRQSSSTTAQRRGQLCAPM